MRQSRIDILQSTRGRWLRSHKRDLCKVSRGTHTRVQCYSVFLFPPVCGLPLVCTDCNRKEKGGFMSVWCSKTIAWLFPRNQTTDDWIWIEKKKKKKNEWRRKKRRKDGSSSGCGGSRCEPKTKQVSATILFRESVTKQ